MITSPGPAGRGLKGFINSAHALTVDLGRLPMGALKQKLDRTAQFLTESLSATRVSIALRDKDNFELVSAVGTYVKSRPMPIVSYASKKGVTLVLNGSNSEAIDELNAQNPGLNFMEKRGKPGRFTVVPFVVAPLQEGMQDLGVICVNKEQPFEDWEISAINILASITAQQIHGERAIKGLSALISHELGNQNFALSGSIEAAENVVIGLEATVYRSDVDAMLGLRTSAETSISISALEDLRGLIRSARGSALKSCDIIESVLVSTGMRPATIEQIETHPVKPTHAMAKHVHILLVDDEPQICVILQSLLEKRGFKVTTANNGETALDAFKKGSFDLVMTDLTMPGMDGVDLARKLREIVNNIPICVVTSTPLGYSDKLSSFIQEKDVHYRLKDFRPLYISRILDVPNEIALRKAGIETEGTGSTAPLAVATTKTHQPIMIWRGRLGHKLNNIITTIMGYRDLLSHNFNPKYLTNMREAYDRCKKAIEELRIFTEAFNARKPGDLELLPEDLRADEETQEALAKLSAMGSEEYIKVGRTAALAVILYTRFLKDIGEQLKLLEKNHDPLIVNGMTSLTNELASINSGLMAREDTPENSRYARIFDAVC